MIPPMEVAVILNPNAGSAEEMERLRRRLERQPSLEGGGSPVVFETLPAALAVLTPPDEEEG